MKSGFFDNTEVVSEDFARLVSGIVTSGVLNDSKGELLVTPGGGMKVSVAPGYCWIEGHFGRAEVTETLSIDTASGSVGRIDRIVARCDYSTCKVSLKVIKGEEGSEPTPPPIVRDGTYYDLGLATVSVPAGTIEITDSLMTDTRADSSVCGGCLMRTGVVLDLSGKADKTALAEANTRIDKNAEDIAVQAARGLARKTFEGASETIEQDYVKSCTVNVPGDFKNAGVLKLSVSGAATIFYPDDTEIGDAEVSGRGVCTLYGVGDTVNEGFSLYNGSIADGMMSCTITLNETYIEVTVTITGLSIRESAKKISATVSDISGVFMT
ncbi:MAG: hypothetical protein ACI4J7_06045 [Ruminiclostridium sp.]